MRSLIHSLCGGVDTPLLGGGWLNCIFECGGMCVEIKGVVLRYIGDKSHLLIFLWIFIQIITLTVIIHALNSAPSDLAHIFSSFAGFVCWV